MERVFQGSCHCKRTRFEISADPDHVRICDCSICHQRGALIIRIDAAQFRLLTPLDDMALYEWGSGTAKDYFCKTCGILPFRRPRAATQEELAQGVPAFDGWAINGRCIKGLDIAALPVRQIHGKHLPVPKGF